MAPLSNDYTLTVRQGPERAKVTGPKEKERKPVDPPPIVQLYIRDPLDTAQNYLQSPYLFMCANLCNADLDNQTPLASQDVLSGTLVSSLHRLKDVDNTDGGFFVFGDLKRPVSSSLRSDELQPALEDSLPSTHYSTALQPQRTPTGMYSNRYSSLGEPAAKRQRVSTDLSDRLLYDSERFSQRSSMDQRNSFGAYAARDPTANMFSPAYSQGAHSVMSNMSDYSYGHQRTNSSNTSSPFVSPHTDISSHSWPSTNMFYQPTVKDTSFTYPHGQFSELQPNRPSQLAEPFMRHRGHNFSNRLPVNNTFSFSRSQEPEVSGSGIGGQVTRSFAPSSHFSDPSSRLPSNENIGENQSPGRQYPATPMSNVLPPLESTISSNQSRGSLQQALPNNVLPSIETPNLLSGPNHSEQEQAQDDFDSNDGYDPAPFSFPIPNQKRSDHG
ncbi:MAG: hypothetical protein Q9219_002176 [cf. Caloplaca sp. 3 TL-2023]